MSGSWTGSQAGAYATLQERIPAPETRVVEMRAVRRYPSTPWLGASVAEDRVKSRGCGGGDGGQGQVILICSHSDREVGEAINTNEEKRPTGQG